MHVFIAGASASSAFAWSDASWKAATRSPRLPLPLPRHLNYARWAPRPSCWTVWMPAR
jgi:hypothetical protein